MTTLITEFDKPVAKSTAMRTKFPSIDLLRDSPFAIDRSLEDQKCLICQNKVRAFFEFMF
jgi:hypothetical protein